MKLFKRLAVTTLAAVTLSLTAISSTSAADWKAAYREQLLYMRTHSYSYCPGSTDAPWITYTVYDIDKDGIKELLVDVGTCEADRQVFFYTYSGGKVVSLGSKSSWHSGFSGCSGNGLLVYSALMGYENEYKLTKKGNTLYTTVLFQDRYAENYHEPSYYMTFIDASDYSYVPY